MQNTPSVYMTTRINSFKNCYNKIVIDTHKHKMNYLNLNTNDKHK